jgi:molybdopterin synthase sulfur carrier subunit
MSVACATSPRAAASGPAWRSATMPNLRVAVNQEMARPDTPVKAGDEVAFFPPVTGG